MISSFEDTGKLNARIHRQTWTCSKMYSYSGMTWTDSLQIRQSDLAYMTFGDDFFRSLWTKPRQEDVVLIIPEDDG